MSSAKEICDQAAGLVGGDRAAAYGDVVENYSGLAALWSAYLGVPITPLQAAMCMVLVKVERTKLGPFRADNFVDMAGYSGVAGEIAKRTA